MNKKPQRRTRTVHIGDIVKLDGLDGSWQITAIHKGVIPTAYKYTAMPTTGQQLEPIETFTKGYLSHTSRAGTVYAVDFARKRIVEDE